MSFNLGAPILNHCATISQRALPPVCLLCSCDATSVNLCAGCRAELPYLPAARCPSCAAPSFAGSPCGTCLSHPPHYDRTFAPCAYSFPLDRLIQDFKYAGNLAVAPALATLMLAVVGAVDPPSVIVPMPLSRTRLRERGFNQSLELARLLARDTGIALDSDALIRVRDTAVQSELPWTARAKNVRGAFVGMRDLAGQRVAVVDDVLTTGATMNEAARVLKACGAERVYAWVGARTLPHGA